MTIYKSSDVKIKQVETKVDTIDTVVDSIETKVDAQGVLLATMDGKLDTIIGA